MLATMKRPKLNYKGTLARLFQDVAEAWRRQEYSEAISLLEHATRLAPANAGILLDLGRAYGMRYDYDAAERHLEKAVSIAAHRVEGLVEAGRRCQEFGHYE